MKATYSQILRAGDNEVQVDKATRTVKVNNTLSINADDLPAIISMLQGAKKAFPKKQA